MRSLVYQKERLQNSLKIVFNAVEESTTLATSPVMQKHFRDHSRKISSKLSGTKEEIPLHNKGKRCLGIMLSCFLFCSP